MKELYLTLKKDEGIIPNISMTSLFMDISYSNMFIILYYMNNKMFKRLPTKISELTVS